VNLFRERNSKLVPELLKRLKELQARGEEEREKIRSVLKLEKLPNPYRTFDQIVQSCLIFMT
jgi:hypothetical protein